MRVVIAQVEGRVAEVPEQVEVRDRPIGVRSAVHGQVDRVGEVLAGRVPVAFDVVQAAGEKQLEAPGAPGVVRGDLQVDRAGRQGGSAVGAVAAGHCGRRGHLECADRVVGGDQVRGPGEDPVRVGRGAHVDLDPGPEPVDVCAQQRVVIGLLASRGQEGRGPGGLAGRPRVAGRREPTPGSGVRVGGDSAERSWASAAAR